MKQGIDSRKTHSYFTGPYIEDVNQLLSSLRRSERMIQLAEGSNNIPVDSWPEAIPVGSDVIHGFKLPVPTR
jgi:hypothetical protein